MLYNVGFTNQVEHQSLRPGVRVVCRMFRTNNEDHLKKSWISSGRKIDLSLPAYAMSTQQKNHVKKELEKLIEQHSQKLLFELKVGQNGISSMIIDEACRRREQVSSEK